MHAREMEIMLMMMMMMTTTMMMIIQQSSCSCPSDGFAHGLRSQQEDHRRQGAGNSAGSEGELLVDVQQAGLDADGEGLRGLFQMRQISHDAGLQPDAPLRGREPLGDNGLKVRVPGHELERLWHALEGHGDQDVAGGELGGPRLLDSALRLLLAPPRQLHGLLLGGERCQELVLLHRGPVLLALQALQLLNRRVVLPLQLLLRRRHGIQTHAQLLNAPRLELPGAGRAPRPLSEALAGLGAGPLPPREMLQLRPQHGHCLGLLRTEAPLDLVGLSGLGEPPRALLLAALERLALGRELRVLPGAVGDQGAQRRQGARELLVALLLPLLLELEIVVAPPQLQAAGLLRAAEPAALLELLGQLADARLALLHLEQCRLVFFLELLVPLRHRGARALLLLQPLRARRPPLRGTRLGLVGRAQARERGVALGGEAGVLVQRAVQLPLLLRNLGLALGGARTQALACTRGRLQLLLVLAKLLLQCARGGHEALEPTLQFLLRGPELKLFLLEPLLKLLLILLGRAELRVLLVALGPQPGLPLLVAAAARRELLLEQLHLPLGALHPLQGPVARGREPAAAAAQGRCLLARLPEVLLDLHEALGVRALRCAGRGEALAEAREALPELLSQCPGLAESALEALRRSLHLVALALQPLSTALLAAQGSAKSEDALVPAGAEPLAACGHILARLLQAGSQLPDCLLRRANAFAGVLLLLREALELLRRAFVPLQGAGSQLLEPALGIGRGLLPLLPELLGLPELALEAPALVVELFPRGLELPEAALELAARGLGSLPRGEAHGLQLCLLRQLLLQLLDLQLAF
mmetsp:Transcript_47499/g.152523  ORF Transcript_47499/g.152523 Transcript_47499/m.152523 type:complete len:816 (+) Transcript_47499:111-2558(+)